MSFTKRNLCILTLFLLFQLTGKTLFAQQVFYSQYQYAPLLVNPAQVVNDYDIKAIAFYRNQYRQPDPNYRTPSFTFILPFVKKESNLRWGGIGLNAYSDQTGNAPRLFNQGISISYAHNIKLSKRTYLGVGVQGGYYQFGFSASDFMTGEQYSNNTGFDGNLSNGESSLNRTKSYLDLSSGIQLTGEDTLGKQKYNAGFSVYHLNRPNYSLLSDKNNLPILYQLHGGYRIFYDGTWALVPEIYGWISDKNYRFSAGVKAIYYFNQDGALKNGHLALIPRYNHNNSIGAGIELAMTNIFVAFNYDFNRTPLSERISAVGAYEVAIGYRKTLFRKKEPVPLPDYTLGDLRKLYKTEDLEQINNQLKDGSGKYRQYNENDTSWYRSKDYRFELEKRFTFEFNETGIGQDAKKFADDLAALLKDNPNLKLSIIGYSDDIGTEKANIYISTERAKSFMKYMESKGINPKRLRYEGKGESDLLYPNKTKAEREKNRRVRFLIY